jgi:hypothetical protein
MSHCNVLSNRMYISLPELTVLHQVVCFARMDTFVQAPDIKPPSRDHSRLPRVTPMRVFEIVWRLLLSRGVKVYTTVQSNRCTHLRYALHTSMCHHSLRRREFNSVGKSIAVSSWISELSSRSERRASQCLMILRARGITSGEIKTADL